jgi:D-alanyl-D-alanine carboxypeptidase
LHDRAHAPCVQRFSRHVPAPSGILLAVPYDERALRERRARAREERRRRRNRRLLGAALVVLVAAIAAAGITLVGGGGSTPVSGTPSASAAPPKPPAVDSGTAPVASGHQWGRTPDPSARVTVDFRRPPRAGLLVDASTGRVLWSHNAERKLPIASVTKMMTALIVDERAQPSDKARITRAAVTAPGSRVGMLPLGKRAQVETLLYGLLLPSGNDAAVALAQHVGGSVPRFVRMMNNKARELGLTCTRFASPSGIVDQGNYACAPDLALLARDLLQRPNLARIVRTPNAVLPLPIRGGKLWLSGHDPLLEAHYAGADGIKTGFTDAAGSCFVGAAHRNGHRLIVVLLHSPNTVGQSERLLDNGFAALARKR